MQQDQLQQLSQMRAHAMEQFAQIHDQIDNLNGQKHKLKNRGALLLEDLRNLTAKINELSAQAEKEKTQAHDTSAQAETNPG